MKKETINNLVVRPGMALLVALCLTGCIKEPKVVESTPIVTMAPITTPTIEPTKTPEPTPEPTIDPYSLTEEEVREMATNIYKANPGFFATDFTEYTHEPHKTTHCRALWLILYAI